MGSRDFLPTTDAGLLEWTQNFKVGLLEEPLSLGITELQANEYAAKQQDYAARYAAANAEETRGTRATFLKNEAKQVLVNLTRVLARQINNFSSVTNAQRQLLGLTIRKTEPARPAPPTEAPVLNVLAINGRNVKLKIARTDGKRGRPAKAMGTILFVCQAESPDAPNVNWSVLANTGKNTLEIPFPPSETTDTFWIVGQYYNGAKEPGPLSTPVRAVLVAQGLQPSILNKSEPVKLAA
jgi:hypothetical protein